MSLTVNDVKKIESMINYKLEPINQKLAKIEEDIEVLKSIKEIIIDTHRFITTEFKFLSGRVDNHELRITKIEN
jgi:adenylate kinase